MQPTPHPVLFLVSAPSGAGKTTLCKQLLATHPELRYSVSCTTRPPREGEKHGEDYFFMSREAFEAKIMTDDFLEHAEVYGNYYGTEVSFVTRAIANGNSVLLDVDVQGAEKIRSALQRPGIDPRLRQAFCDVFVLPPSLQALKQRLTQRGKDREDVIQHRLEQAESEIQEANRYQYQFQNGDLNEAVLTFQSIYRAAAYRTWHTGRT
ncbi:MAG: guanylate kinase [Verrucomicrobia bacterium]|nr:guanylate kinase [Verrucomicrobiota bacterium]MCH8527215.1 guanylate kinase [Kiritimatiellia bacterium]